MIQGTRLSALQLAFAEAIISKVDCSQWGWQCNQAGNVREAIRIVWVAAICDFFTIAKVVAISVSYEWIGSCIWDLPNYQYQFRQCPLSHRHRCPFPDRLVLSNGVVEIDRWCQGLASQILGCRWFDHNTRWQGSQQSQNSEVNLPTMPSLSIVSVIHTCPSKDANFRLLSSPS